MSNWWKTSDYQNILNTNRGQDLNNLPSKVNYPDYGHVQWGSHGELQDIANTYMQNNGFEYNPPSEYVKVNPDTAAQIAQEYDSLEHNPEDPAVQESYNAFAQETLAQYNDLINAGYVFEFYPLGQDPYPQSPRQAIMDLHENKHMYVYPTDEGYGTQTETTEHPLLEDSGLVWNQQQEDGSTIEKPVTWNDLFRAVHDVFGHAKEGVGFRADGEDNAYRSHSAMYSDTARGAMAAETRGQNSWVNYGPYGETNQTAKTEDTVFADQKAVILPEWARDPDLHWNQVTAWWKESRWGDPDDEFENGIPYWYSPMDKLPHKFVATPDGEYFFPSQVKMNGDFDIGQHHIDVMEGLSNDFGTSEEDMISGEWDGENLEMTAIGDEEYLSPRMKEIRNNFYKNSWWKNSMKYKDFIHQSYEISDNPYDVPGSDIAFAISETGEIAIDKSMYTHSDAEAELNSDVTLQVKGIIQDLADYSASYMFFLPGYTYGRSNNTVRPTSLLTGHIPSIQKIIQDYAEKVEEVGFEFPAYEFNGTPEEALNWLSSLQTEEYPSDYINEEDLKEIVRKENDDYFNSLPQKAFQRGDVVTVLNCDDKPKIEGSRASVGAISHYDNDRQMWVYIVQTSRGEIAEVFETDIEPENSVVGWWKGSSPEFKENDKGNFDLRFEPGEENFMNPHFRVGDEVQVIETDEHGHIEETLDVDTYSVMTDDGEIHKFDAKELQPSDEDPNEYWRNTPNLGNERFVGGDPEAQDFEDPTFSTGDYLDDSIRELKVGDVVRCLLTEEGMGQEDFINGIARIIDINGDTYTVEAENIGTTDFKRDNIELMPVNFNPHYGNDKLGWWKNADSLFDIEEVERQEVSPYLQNINMKYLQENWPMETLVANILDAYENSTEDEYTAGIEWYNKVHNLARQFSEEYGYTFEQICAVFARLSPNLYWDTNYVQAIAFIEAHSQGIKDWKDVKIWTPYSYDGKPCGYGTNNDLAWQILETGDVSLVRGEKIESFFHNFVNGPDDPDTKATVDIWATRVAFNDPLVEPQISLDGSYAYLEQAYNIAADKVGLTPKQLQAVTWVHFKNKYGRNRGPTDYVDRFNEYIKTPMDQRQPPDPSKLSPRPGEDRNQMSLFGWWKNSHKQSDIDWSLDDNDYELDDPETLKKWWAPDGDIQVGDEVEVNGITGVVLEDRGDKAYVRWDGYKGLAFPKTRINYVGTASSERFENAKMLDETETGFKRDYENGYGMIQDLGRMEMENKPDYYDDEWEDRYKRSSWWKGAVSDLEGDSEDERQMQEWIYEDPEPTYGVDSIEEAYEWGIENAGDSNPIHPSRDDFPSQEMYDAYLEGFKIGTEEGIDSDYKELVDEADWWKDNYEYEDDEIDIDNIDQDFDFGEDKRKFQNEQIVDDLLFRDRGWDFGDDGLITRHNPDIPNNLQYDYAEDWFIYAMDMDTGQQYYVNTEMWPEWDMIPEEMQQSEENAVEEFMLPIARRNWNSLNWEKVPTDEEIYKQKEIDDLDDLFKNSWWKGSNIPQDVRDWQNRQLREYDDQERSELYNAIMEVGGIKTRDDLRPEYRGIPNTFKRKDGMDGDELAEHLATHYPYFGINNENDLIDVLRQRYITSWWKGALRFDQQGNPIYDDLEELTWSDNLADDMSVEENRGRLSEEGNFQKFNIGDQVYVDKGHGDVPEGFVDGYDEKNYRIILDNGKIVFAKEHQLIPVDISKTSWWKKTIFDDATIEDLGYRYAMGEQINPFEILPEEYRDAFWRGFYRGFQSKRSNFSLARTLNSADSVPEAIHQVVDTISFLNKEGTPEAQGAAEHLQEALTELEGMGGLQASWWKADYS